MLMILFMRVNPRKDICHENLSQSKIKVKSESISLYTNVFSHILTYIGCNLWNTQHGKKWKAVEMKKGPNDGI